MKIKLVQKIPSKDGYFLMKMSPSEGLHLVLIQTNLDGERVLIPDTEKLQKILTLSDGHDSPFRLAYFSEEPIETEV